MTLEARINALATSIATAVKSDRTLINGNVATLAALTTTAKTNLVVAINELVTKLAALISDSTSTTTSTWSSSKIAAAILALITDGATATTTTWSSSKIVASITAIINDTTASTSSTYSSTKINTAIAAAVSALVNSSPTTLDTLKELADAMGGDPNFATTMATALGSRLRFDAAQTLTAAQKIQGKANLDAYGNVEIGNYDADFAATFAAGLL